MSTPPAPNYDIGSYVSKGVELYTKDIGNWIVIGIVGTFALGVGFWGGFHNCALKALRGEKPVVGDVLMPFQRFGDFFIPGLLVFGAAMLTICLFGIGGIVLSTWWFFAYPLMIERGMSWQDATKLSKEVASQNVIMTFVVALVAGLVGNVAGVVGLSFLTAPLMGIIGVLAYLHVFHGHIPATAGALPAGPPPGAPPQGWAAPAPAAAPAPQGWAAPAPAPYAAPAPAPYAAPAPAPYSAPAPAPFAAPAPAPVAAPLPTQGWDIGDFPPPPSAAGSGAPAAAPAPSASPAPAAAPGVETATQATAGAEEAYVGKTVAMSALDFEAMLRDNKK